ncbi:MAG: sulfur carrier protein ThiS [Thermodesulfovibrionales bacterium]
MQITLNGAQYDTAAGSVAELLRELNIEVGRVAVEVNFEVVRKVDFPTRRLGQGDRVEIVNFVGGG